MKARAKEDQFIVGYLLGLSSEIEQGQVETRYFKDQRFYEQVLLVEEELICEYLGNDLSGVERRRFENHFLQSPHRRKKYDATRKLMAYIADQGALTKRSATLAPNPANPTSDLPTGLPNWLSGLLMPKFGMVGMMTATAMLLLCGLWLANHIAGLRQTMRQAETERIALQQQEQALRGTALRQRAEAAAKRDEAASLTELVASGAGNLSAALGHQEAQPTPTIKLTLATVRGATAPREINLPAEAQTISVAIQLERQTGAATTEAGHYLVKLRATESVSPTWQWETAPQNQQLLIEFPATGVTPGLYSLTVARMSAQQPNEFAGEILLRVSRR